MNAYVVFKDQDSVAKALELNGKVFRDKHIRVDTIVDPKLDFKSTIFVGNIPFTAKEEELWKRFTEFGEVKNVRIVRDRRTQQAKGVAYITFATKEQRVKAVAGKVILEGRELRIKKATSKYKLDKKEKSRAEIVKEKIEERKKKREESERAAEEKKALADRKKKKEDKERKATKKAEKKAATKQTAEKGAKKAKVDE